SQPAACNRRSVASSAKTGSPSRSSTGLIFSVALRCGNGVVPLYCLNRGRLFGTWRTSPFGRANVSSETGRRAAGYGTEYRPTGARVTGAALVADGRVAHLMAFPAMAPLQ